MAAPVLSPWDLVEPSFAEPSMYSDTLKVDLLSGTFVLLTHSSTTRTLTPSRDDTTSARSHAGTPTVTATATTDNSDEATIVARIVGIGDTCPTSGATVRVNIFKSIKELRGEVDGFVSPSPLNHNHLRNIIEVVQTTEVRSVPISDIVNLSFVFSIAMLLDPLSYFVHTKE